MTERLTLAAPEASRDAQLILLTHTLRQHQEALEAMLHAMKIAGVPEIRPQIASMSVSLISAGSLLAKATEWVDGEAVRRTLRETGARMGDGE